MKSTLSLLVCLLFVAIGASLNLPVSDVADPMKSGVSGDVCADCMAFLTDVSMIIKNATTQETVLSKLKQLCKVVESPSCTEFVDDYGTLVISYVAELFVPKTLCSDLTLCPNPAFAIKHTFQIHQTDTNGNVCSDCVAFMTDISLILKNTTFQQDVTAKLKQLCEVFGSSSCVTDVEDYGQFALSYLATLFVPKTVCTDLTFCPQSQTGIAILEKVLFQKPKVTADVCDDCLDLMNDFSMMLRNATNQKVIVVKLKHLCELFGSSSCGDAVNTYGSLVFAYLPYFFVPKTVCADLTFCPQSSRTPVEEKLIYIKSGGAGDVCTDCIALMTDISQMLKNTTNQKIIIGKLKEICEVFGSSSCVDSLNDYGTLMFYYISGLFVPKTICADLTLCQQLQDLAIARKRQIQQIIKAELLKTT